MRVPLSWLREFVPVEAEPDALAERLSLGGFAVEETIRTGAGISGVVVGEIRSVRDHPDADNLVLVRAFDGERERDIVCGARNFGPGDRVPLALPGARLPGGVEIGRREVRGEQSDGMLCSSAELRVSEDHAGIMVLDPDAPLGADVVRALDLDDVIYHLDVTTNRGDCLSIVGIAREVAALYGLPLTVPLPKVPEDDGPAEERASVRIDDTKGCPRYLARVIEGVRVGPSPWWMRRRILACAMRPISNVVDVTNYVLLERGHPLHAFDLATLGGSAIVVRRPRSRERIVTLDGVERALERDDVMICDAGRPVAVGGVMGGAETEVTEGTAQVLLEAAYFDPLRIRRTAARLGLRTEASVRFERGADPEAVRPAADRAAELFAQVCGGRVARGAIDAYPRPPRRRTVRLRAGRARHVLGADVPAERMATDLRALGCDVEMSRQVLRVTVPTHRPDLEIEEDLIEEVARLHGYDRLPETLPSRARIGSLTWEQRRGRTARAILAGRGLSEAQTLSLISPALPDRLGLAADHPWRNVVRLQNPLSEEESTLRPSLVPGLLLAAQRNAARRVLPVMLYEIGRVFAAGAPPGETLRAAWVMAGSAPVSWHGARDLDLFDAKGTLEALLRGLGIGTLELETGGDRGGAFHPARSATVRVDGQPVGVLAEIHPRAAEALGLPDRVAVCEIDLDPVLARAPRAVEHTVSRFPAVARDLALVVPEGTPATEVEGVIRGAGGALLESAALFDVYRGSPVPEGHVSLAYALFFRDPERTLTDTDADAAFGAIVESARARGWSVRE